VLDGYGVRWWQSINTRFGREAQDSSDGRAVLTQPTHVPTPRLGYFKLDRHYEYNWENHRLTIWAGFVWDLATIPGFWLLWLLGYRADGLHRAAALVHDYIYRLGGTSPYGVHERFDGEAWHEAHSWWTRLQADRLFAGMMREAEVVRWRCMAMYVAVRMCGWWAWRESRSNRARVAQFWEQKGEEWGGVTLRWLELRQLERFELAPNRGLR
jgi:hypothetical protein